MSSSMSDSDGISNDNSSSNGGLTVDLLKELLAEQVQVEVTNQEKAYHRSVQDAPTKRSIHQFYQKHGIVSPIDKPEKGGRLWVRPIPPTLYRCPVSIPLTTLVVWDSLPRTVQELYDPPPVDGSCGGIIEVNRNHLLTDNDDVWKEDVVKNRTGQQQQQQQMKKTAMKEQQQQPKSLTRSSGLQRRKLGGNLTDKLTEYTRGMSGQARPFIPGGADLNVVTMSTRPTNNNKMGDGGLKGGTVEEEAPTDPFLSSEAIEKSLRVLTQGTKASWEDGSLITAPPGVDFKVGLSYHDIYGEEMKTVPSIESGSPPTQAAVVSNECNVVGIDGDNDTPSFRQIGGSEIEPMAASSVRQQITRAVKWDQSFLDDDSLFGSSASDTDDEEDDENDEEEEKAAVQDDDDNKTEAEKIKEHEAVMTNSSRADTLSETIITGSDEELDKLLKELTLAEARTKREIIRRDQTGDSVDDNTTINPLKLAERQAQLQQDTTRKSWASTALLPIDDFHSYIPNPALKYPFTLDTFQQQAVARLERNESVFVAAHTSAGKTVVAEYAVALSRQRGTRCVYTSPIKALSNQKFRDFSLKFGSENVGLITGDLQLNVDGSTCLIMTTEILRSMLYRGADLIRDIEWVVFDEVHYVNDSERGVVWEEVIIMLPAYVNLIFLSATTPNTLEFSDWIGRTKRKPVYVIKTDYRPVPLSHYLWANLKLHKVKEGNSGFLDKGYQDASAALNPKSDNKKGGANTKGGKPVVPTSTARGPQQMAWQAQGSKAQWMSLIRFLEREDLIPSVVFSFSKKKCEEITDMLRSLDLNTAMEGNAVRGFTLQTVARLSPGDAVLPQVVTVCEMVKRGIGVHHGGLLPILKEMVEILFSRNLIKVLFATETFAMGVNMPARSVVFNSIRKHDGNQFRVLEPGEYTQMAGRAGRRGLDSVGTVVMCCFGEQPPPIGMLRNMLTGSSTMLRSQFRLTFNMILNLLRVEEMSVEGMIKRSFSEFATQRALTANEYPKLLARGQKTLTKLLQKFEADAGQRVGAEDLEDYFSTCGQLMRLNNELLLFIGSSGDGHGDSVLQPGRVILVTAARKYDVVRAPALILESPRSGAADSAKGGECLVCMVLLPQTYTSQEGTGSKEVKPLRIGAIRSSKQRYYGIYKIGMDQILLVTGTKKKIDPGLLYEAKPSSNAAVGGDGRNLASTAFFGTKPASRNFDNPFAGMKAKSKKDSEDFFGKEKSMSHSSSEAAIDDAMGILLEAERQENTAGLPQLDILEYLKRGNDVVELRRRGAMIGDLVTMMRSFKSHYHPTIEKYYTLLERIHTLQDRVDSLSHLLSNEALQLFPDFLQRKAVLTTLGYIDENEAVAVKGRVACEVNTCEELIVTEMVFEGILNDLDPTQIVAALSALVYQQKSEDDDFDMEVPEALLNCCRSMKTIALNLGQLQKEHGLDVDPIDYAESSLKFGLVHVVYEWAIGVPFSEICQLTSAQEGSIVRCITRLDELCREVRNCARVVGNPTLYRKMEAASVAIKRDIVFAASLYVS